MYTYLFLIGSRRSLFCQTWMTSTYPWCILGCLWTPQWPQRRFHLRSTGQSQRRSEAEEKQRMNVNNVIFYWFVHVSVYIFNNCVCLSLDNGWLIKPFNNHHSPWSHDLYVTEYNLLVTSQSCSYCWTNLSAMCQRDTQRQTEGVLRWQPLYSKG